MKLPNAVHRSYRRFVQPEMFLRANAFNPAKGADAGNVWDEFSTRIVAEVRSAPASFLRKETVRKCLHPDSQRLASRLLGEMARDEDFAKTIARASEPAFGNPYSLWQFPRLSPTAIVHLYYLYLIEKNLGLPVSDIASITEIGGGYGGLCRTVHSLGFEGDYTIVDLPGMLAIQDHYLGHTLPQTAPDVSLTTTDKYSPKDRAGSILIATFSLNEMPLATRKIVESWMPHFDYLFFAHNNVFDGIDNVAYFEELADRLSSSFAITKRHEPRWCHVVFAKNKR